MINAVDKAKYPLHKKVEKLSLVERADETVDIREILKPMGVWTPEGMFYSYKINCPWDYEHSDGGRDKNCRLFGKTNIYCWALHGFITPTILYARWKGVPREHAAKILLEERGLIKKSWREQWNILIDERDTAHSSLGVKSDVVASLHSMLDAEPEYVKNEFNASVRAKWEQVLSALDKLWELPDVNFELLNQFFDASLTVLINTAKLEAAKEN